MQVAVGVSGPAVLPPQSYMGYQQVCSQGDGRSQPRQPREFHASEGFEEMVGMNLSEQPTTVLTPFYINLLA